MHSGPIENFERAKSCSFRGCKFGKWIYYDGEGDFLEITFGEPPEIEYTDEIEEGVFITRSEATDEVYSIGILSFKKRVALLGKILSKFNKKLPNEIDISKQFSS